MMKKKLYVLIIIDILLMLGLLLTGCGKKSTTGTEGTAEGESALIEKSGTVIGSLSDIEADLSDKTLDDFDVPSADLNLPTAEVGSLDMDLTLDTAVDIPDLAVPDAAAGLSASDISVSSGSGGTTVNDETCARFDSVPDCSYVPENVRDLCEECKNRNK